MRARRNWPSLRLQREGQENGAIEQESSTNVPARAISPPVYPAIQVEEPEVAPAPVHVGPAFIETRSGYGPLDDSMELDFSRFTKREDRVAERPAPPHLPHVDHPRQFSTLFGDDISGEEQMAVVGEEPSPELAPRSMKVVSQPRMKLRISAPRVSRASRRGTVQENHDMVKSRRGFRVGFSAQGLIAIPCCDATRDKQATVLKRVPLLASKQESNTKKTIDDVVEMLLRTSLSLSQMLENVGKMLRQAGNPNLLRLADVVDLFKALHVVDRISRETESRDSERFRRHSLAQWLQRVNSQRQNTMNVNADIWLKILHLLAALKLSEARNVAIDQKAYNVATLISTAGCSAAREGIDGQKEGWKDREQPNSLIDLYRLLSGDVKSVKGKLNPTWREGVALCIAYCCENTDTLEQVCEKYLDELDEPIAEEYQPLHMFDKNSGAHRRDASMLQNKPVPSGRGLIDIGLTILWDSCGQHGVGENWDFLHASFAQPESFSPFWNDWFGPFVVLSLYEKFRKENGLEEARNGPSKQQARHIISSFASYLEELALYDSALSVLHKNGLFVQEEMVANRSVSAGRKPTKALDMHAAALWRGVKHDPKEKLRCLCNEVEMMKEKKVDEATIQTRKADIAKCLLEEALPHLWRGLFVSPSSGEAGPVLQEVWRKMGLVWGEKGPSASTFAEERELLDFALELSKGENARATQLGPRTVVAFLCMWKHAVNNEEEAGEMAQLKVDLKRFMKSSSYTLDHPISNSVLKLILSVLP